MQGLEQSLGVVVREFEEEKRRTEERHHEHLQLARWEEGGGKREGEGRRKEERELIGWTIVIAFLPIPVLSWCPCSGAASCSLVR